MKIHISEERMTQARRGGTIDRLNGIKYIIVVW